MGEWWKVAPLLLTLVGCAPKPHPAPEPTPTAIVAPLPGPMPAPQPCGPAMMRIDNGECAVDCAHRMCPAGTICETGRGCVADPLAGCLKPEGLIPGPPGVPDEYKQTVRDAEAAFVGRFGDPCGHKSAAECDQTLEGLADILRSRGFCAYRDEDRVLVKHKKTEELDPDIWAEHHPVYYLDGCFLSNTFKGVLVQP